MDDEEIICQDVMLDLETLGTKPGSAVIAIGAVFFNREKAHIGPTYHQAIDIASVLQYGFGVDGDTLKWWLGQGDDARQALLDDTEKLVPTLMDFAHFVTDDIDGGVEEEVKVWGNSAAFDNVLLRTMYEGLNLRAPWQWWNDRCYRTLKKERDPKMELAPKRTGTHHHARDDALFQTYHLLNIDAGYRRFEDISEDGQAQMELQLKEDQ